MNNIQHEKKDFASDIDYHLTEIEADINRAIIDNNRNLNLVRLFDNLLSRIDLLRVLINSEPKAYFNVLHSEMQRLFIESRRDLDGFNVIISLKIKPEP